MRRVKAELAEKLEQISVAKVSALQFREAGSGREHWADEQVPLCAA